MCQTSVIKFEIDKHFPAKLTTFPRSCRPSHAGKIMFDGSEDASPGDASSEPIINRIVPAWEGRQLRGQLIISFLPLIY